MLLSAVSVLVVAQSSSEIPEGLRNNPVFSSQQVITEQNTVIFTNNTDKNREAEKIGIPQ